MQEVIIQNTSDMGDVGLEKDECLWSLQCLLEELWYIKGSTRVCVYCVQCKMTCDCGYIVCVTVVVIPCHVTIDQGETHV